MSTRTLTIAANQGAIGGGEVMGFAIAEAARMAGWQVTIAAPADPGEVIAEAERRGFAVAAIGGTSTAGYLRQLRRWDSRHRKGLLWCNGLRPAFATAGRSNRVVELHQRPVGRQRAIAELAVMGARRVLAPSQWLADDVPDAKVLWNWSSAVPQTTRVRAPGEPFTVGFLGRLSSDKGVVVLCQAMAELERRQPGRYRLVLAGESRFVDDADVQRVQASVAALGPLAERWGWTERDDFFAAVDLAVFPSVFPEAFGLVAAEAMSARVPFVISDAGALPEVAGEAWVAPAGDAFALADVIAQASADPTRYVEAGYTRWLENYSPQAGQRRIAGLLHELAAPWRAAG